MRKYLVFLLLSCFTISCTQQENINDLIKKAEQGDVEAQFNLGIAYEKGYGVEQSYEKAVYWYTKAAEQGNANAQNNLGVAYHNGNGVEQDKNKAIYWFRKACENSNDDACKNLNRIK